MFVDRLATAPLACLQWCGRGDSNLGFFVGLVKQHLSFYFLFVVALEGSQSKY